jgi:NAD(P)-dependent dehydrogenase (short-subunit alcohol dehydrogenase family)
MPFSQHSTTDEVIAGVDLRGKTAVVTGASAGLGIETVKTLAGAGARVVMVARDPARLEAAVDAVRQQHADAALETRLMDLADLASIRAAADDLRQRFPAIHILINNAGVMACPFERTRDGFELQFGTNHLGHFLLSCLLAPALLAAAPARVVTLSSAGHKFAGIDFEDPNYQHRDYEKWQAYGQSKTANALFSVALNKRLSGRGVTANAVHPGMIVTELGRHLDRSDIESLQSRASEQQQQFKSIPAGAATSVWAATSPDLDGRGGLYLEDCQVGQEEQGESSGYTEYALEPRAAEALWRLSEELVGENFELAN